MMQGCFLRRLFVLLGLSGLSIAAAAMPGQAAELSARSAAQTVALLELYTSEGCNSCPPADDWVNALSGKGFGLDRVIPLSLHVDYWNDLGWPDRFAQAIFTKRQREIAARQRSRTIYTPQLVLQGQSLTQWETFRGEVQRINHTRARADLTLTASTQPALALSITAQANIPDVAQRQQAKMYVVLYENRLTSDVKAGENKGRTLRHNHVVREFIGPLDIDTEGTARWQRRVTLSPEWKTPDMGAVVFVQQPQNGDVLQALALPLGQ